MSLSVRKSIRWPPSLPSEPTSTLVVTSPTHQYYVDIRVLDTTIPPSLAVPTADIAGPSPPNSPALVRRNPKSLEWAFAGSSGSGTIDPSAVDVADGEAVNGSKGAHERRNSSRSKLTPKKRMHWSHWVDSQTNKPENVKDEGEIEQTGPNTTRETGKMLNPETGTVMPYEEIWQDLKSASSACVVLRAENEALGTRGMVIRVGDWCQGILKIGHETSCERWQLRTADPSNGSAERRWERVLHIDHHQASLPCQVACERKDMTGGTEIRSGGLTWVCLESSTLEL